MTTLLEEMTSMQAELMSMKELTDALEQSSNQEALSAKKQVSDHVQELTNKLEYKKLNIQPVKSSTMDFAPTITAFPIVWSFVCLCQPSHF